VLEFYASTEAGAILVNLRGAKEGCMGRPLPGSAEVRIGAYDVEQGRLCLRRDGFVEQSGIGEIGMLLARVRTDEPWTGTPLRGVFASEDAWLATGDLFLRDEDGDYWRVDSTADVIDTAHGAVLPGPIREALGDLPAVDLAVAYGVPVDGDEHMLAVAAVTLRAGRELDARDIGAAVRGLERQDRPAIVRVVERIPVTTWFRPLTVPLRKQGIPDPDDGAPAWYLDAGGEHYRPMTGAAHRRLARAKVA
jgi:putative long chain acyl-CoA synthase